LSDENQESISGILANTNRISEQLADTGPQVEETLTTLRGTLAQSTETLAAFEDTLRSTYAMINDEGGGVAVEMRRTMVAAQGAAEALEATLEDARPATRELATTTLPAVNATLKDLQRTSAAMRALTERIETQ